MLTAQAHRPQRPPIERHRAATHGQLVRKPGRLSTNPARSWDLWSRIHYELWGKIPDPTSAVSSLPLALGNE